MAFKGRVLPARAPLPALDLYRNYAAILYYRTAPGRILKDEGGLIYPGIIPRSYYSRPCVIPVSEPAGLIRLDARER